MQLQRNLDQFTRAGISVFAISYDPVEAQAAFASQNGITYPLLSDGDHKVIEATGILNRLVDGDAGFNAGGVAQEQAILKVAPNPVSDLKEKMGVSLNGIPYPGSYLIGMDGLVTEKLFYQHYRTRPSVATVLRSGFDVDFEVRDNPRAEVSGDGVQIRATLGGESMTFMETSTLYVEINLDAGLHLYGAPVPEGYVATKVTVTGPDSVETGAAKYPATRPFRVAGLDETFAVFEGALEIAVPLYYVREDFEHLLARGQFLANGLTDPAAGLVRQLVAHAQATRPPEEQAVDLDVSVSYQACTESACLAPQMQRLRLSVPIAPLNTDIPDLRARLDQNS